VHLQPCVSFNHRNIHQWYREPVHELEEEGHDPGNKLAAFANTQEWGDRIPIRPIYEKKRPVYEERLPALRKMTLVMRRIARLQFEELLGEFVQRCQGGLTLA